MTLSPCPTDPTLAALHERFMAAVGQYRDFSP
jgi:hypothetical protein